MEGIKRYIANLYSVLTSMRRDELKQLYGDLLTKSEVVMFAKRLEIARGLLAGQSYLQIQKRLGVTANTVSQIQKVLKRSGHGFRIATKFLTTVETSASSAPLRPRSRSVFGTVFSRLFTFSEKSKK